MRGARTMLRRLIGGRTPSIPTRSSSISENLILTAATASYSTLMFADESLFISGIAPSPATNFQSALLNYSRSYSSPPSSDSSKVVSIESEDQYNDLLRKIQDESLPAIFYFTAVWCGPCRLLSPIIGQLSEKYPNVTTYKIDIDKEELRNALSKLNIHSVEIAGCYMMGKILEDLN